MSRGGRSGGKRRGDAMTFSLESMGLSRGEVLPPPTLIPPPNYPTTDSKALPLHDNDVDNYWLTLKQEMRQSLTTSKYYINPVKDKPKIERYSDKYENIVNDIALNDDIEIDWRLFPTELWPKDKRKNADKVKTKTNKDVNKRLEDLVKKESEEKSDVENSDKEVEENLSDEDKVVEDIEDVEEGTDYTFSYFDNGDNYLEESDDNIDEGPTY